MLIAQELPHVQRGDLVETEHVQEVKRLPILALIKEARAFHLISLARQTGSSGSLSSILLLRDALLLLLKQRLVHVAGEVFDFLITGTEDVKPILLSNSALQDLLLVHNVLVLEQSARGEVASRHIIRRPSRGLTRLGSCIAVRTKQFV